MRTLEYLNMLDGHIVEHAHSHIPRHLNNVLLPPCPRLIDHMHRGSGDNPVTGHEMTPHHDVGRKHCRAICRCPSSVSQSLFIVMVW